MTRCRNRLVGDPPGAGAVALMLVTATSLLACEHARPERTVAEAPQAPAAHAKGSQGDGIEIGGLVAMPGDQPLYTAPTRNAPWARVGARDTDQSLERGWMLRVTGRERGFLSLSTDVGTEPSASECARRFNTLFDFELELYAPQEAVAPVLRSGVSRKFGDGRALSVGPGAPVKRVAGGWYRVNAGGVHFEMGLAPEQIGQSFAERKPRRKSRRQPGVVLRHDAVLRHHEGRRLDHVERLNSDATGIHVYEVERGQEHALVVVENGCARFRVQVADADLVAVDPSSEPAADGRPLDAERRLDAHARIAPEGTTIHWADRRRAGRVLRDHLFEDFGRTLGGLRCYDVPLRKDLQGDPLQLCFEPDDLREPPEEAVASDAPLTKSEIREVVRNNAADIRRCYGEALESRPDVGGRVVVDFIIGPDGAVSGAEVVRDELGISSVGRCIEEAVAGWRFPKPRGGEAVPISYPFNLVPN